MKEARFTIGELMGIGMTLIVLGIGIAYGVDIVTDLGDDFCTENGGNVAGNNQCYICPPANGSTWNATADACGNSSTGDRYSAGNGARTTTGDIPEYNSTTDAIAGASKLTERLPTIAGIIIASVIIGIIATYLWTRFS